MRPVLALSLSSIIFISSACLIIEDDGEDPPVGEFQVDEASRTTGLVTPEAGGTITSPTGDSLFVPPGAVSEPVEITLTPLLLSTDPESDGLGGVKLEPDGLEFLIPATLTLRMQVAVAPGSRLKVGSAPGVLNELLDMGYFFDADSSGAFASGEIYGFSGKCATRDCHSGTTQALLTAWQGVPGRSAAELAAAQGLTEKQFLACQNAGPLQLQRTMGDFFEPCGSYDTGVAMDDQTKAVIAETVAAGRMVVFLFGGSDEPLVGEIEDGAELGNVAHSAIAVQGTDGDILIRNQLNALKPTNPTKLDTSSVNNVVDFKLSEIDAPNGLRDKRRTEVGLGLQGKQLEDRDKYAKAWSEVVVFCEKPRNGPTCEPVALPNGSCRANDIVCIGTVALCNDADGNGLDDGDGSACCPSDMCNKYGTCVQIECPAGTGRNYDCECCCTAGMGDAGSCDDTSTVFNIRDACFSDRLCSCGSAPATEPTTCGP